MTKYDGEWVWDPARPPDPGWRHEPVWVWVWVRPHHRGLPGPGPRRNMGWVWDWVLGNISRNTENVGDFEFQYFQEAKHVQKTYISLTAVL